MAPRVFITGITGYIGGQVVTDLSKKHPEFQLVGLVRTAKQAEQIKQKLPSVQTVLGDISSHSILLEEAQKADVVVQGALDDIPSVKALIKGLSQGGKGGSYIHMSGAASIVDQTNGYGQLSSRIYDDVKDIAEITTFDLSHIHADTDQAVTREGQARLVNTVMLVPVMIYGEGEGPLKTTSMTLPWLEEAIVKRGKGFVIGEGKNAWSGVHVKDVSAAAILLIEDALRPDGPKAAWGPHGVYYVQEDEYTFANIVPKMAENLKGKGLIKSKALDQITPEEATVLHPWAPMMWGANCRCRATRLRALGWKPVQPSLYEILASGHI